jgi:hypothetical protein
MVSLHLFIEKNSIPAKKQGAIFKKPHKKSYTPSKKQYKKKK